MKWAPLLLALLLDTFWATTRQVCRSKGFSRGGVFTPDELLPERPIRPQVPAYYGIVLRRTVAQPSTGTSSRSARQGGTRKKLPGRNSRLPHFTFPSTTV